MNFEGVSARVLSHDETYKTLCINTPEVWEMYKGIRKRENLQDVKLSQTRCQNPSLSKINRLPMVCHHISP
jgi:hypothetical protein